MSVRPAPNPSAEMGTLIHEIESKALRRLVQLTESDNPRIALRACELVLRYARERRREEAQQTSASGGHKPPEGASPNLSGTLSTQLASPSGGLRPPFAEVKAIPHKLVHPPKPKPAFRAVPLDKLDAVRHLIGPNAT